MTIRWRSMRPKDVAGAIAILANHPVVRLRYENSFDQLHSAWLRLLGCEAFSAIVFEEFEGHTPRLLATAASVFTTHQFIRELKVPPFFWIGPELSRRVARGQSPSLSDREVATENADGGLNLVLWHLGIDTKETLRNEVRAQVSAAFFEMHRGFRLKELVGLQSTSVEEPGWTLDGGAFFLSPSSGSYRNTIDVSPDKVLATPHVFGLTRELAVSRMSWLSSLFHCDAPKMGFSRSEQRLLLAALRGGIDEELSDELVISLSAVKKVWSSVYDRVANQLPDSILTVETEEGRGNGDRGKQKKQRLLAYLRGHPEELRPYSRKTRDQSPAASTLVPTVKLA
ncbi:MAG TPA: hypothetical protein VJP02_10885 [Candidatus Sulfotelmatobacter sp.]|nr:hypothetical protein [Candidatus Sulfotelmatobacter sp.]